jgi:hypothetical protein
LQFIGALLQKNIILSILWFEWKKILIFKDTNIKTPNKEIIKPIGLSSLISIYMKLNRKILIEILKIPPSVFWLFFV